MKTLFIIFFTLCFVCAKAQLRPLPVGTNVVNETDTTNITTQSVTLKQFKVDSTGVYDVVGVISIKTNPTAWKFELDCNYTNWFGIPQAFAFFNPSALTIGDSHFFVTELELQAGTVLQLTARAAGNGVFLYNVSATIRRNR